MSHRLSFRDYAIPLAVLFIAIVVRLLLDPLIGNQLPFVTLFAAVAFAAWYGGRWPGFLVLVLGALSAAFFWYEPKHQFIVHTSDAYLGLTFFALGSCALIVMMESLRSARQKLIAQNDLLKITFSSIGDGVITTDIEACVHEMNSVAEKLTGWTTSEAQGRPLEEVFNIINESTRAKVENPAHRVLREGIIVGLANHTLLIARDGTERPIGDSAAPIKGPDGAVTGCVLVFRDVTETKELEKKVAEQLRAARLLASVVESSQDAIVSKTLEGKIETWNSGAEEVFGYSASEIVGESILKLIPPELRNEEDLIISRIRAGERVEHYETTRRRKDGGLIRVSLTVSPVVDESGKIIGASKIARDITDQKLSQEALAESEERLRLALEAGQMGVWDWNIRTNELKWSASLEPLHGLEPGTFGGTFDAFQQLIHPEDREHVSREIGKAVEAGSEFDVEFRNIRPNGSIHWIAGKGKAIIGADGKPERMIGVGLDVTYLRRSEQTARFLADAGAELAVLVDLDSTLQKVAALAVPHFADWAAVDFLEEDGTLRRVAVAHVDPAKVALAHELHRRYPADPNAPQGVWNIVRSGQAEMVSHISDEMIQAATTDPELLGIMRELGLKSYVGVPLMVRGKVLGAITFISAESGHAYDETDLSIAQDLASRAAVAIENGQLYRQLREADQRKDEFLATLAHELRNPLAPVKNALELMKIAGSDQKMVEHARSTMDRQIGHMVRLIDDLLDVSRITTGRLELKMERVDLAAAVQHALETSRPMVDRMKHDLVAKLPEEPIFLTADLARLAQILGNLLTNASKYTEPGGKIELTVERQVGMAEIRVVDNGIGISAELLPHIFDLFVQADRALDRSEGGLGIGLSLVKRLVEMHGGTVRAFSEGPGRGSEFVVRLPILEKPREVPSLDGDSVESRPPGRRILVVDDNRDNAETLASLLQLTGNETKTGHDGVQAVELAESFRPDLILMDIGLPKMNGYEACQAIRATDWGKEISMVAVTGWGQDEDVRRSREAGFDGHLVKPVDLAKLESTMASLTAK